MNDRHLSLAVEREVDDEGNALASLQENLENAYAMLSILHGRPIEPPKPDATGACGDCGQIHGLFAFGKLTLCHRCVVRRRAAAARLEAQEAA